MNRKYCILGMLALMSSVATNANAAIIYNTPPSSTGLSGYTSTITINTDGSTSIVGGGPNFGGEDSLVHVVNSSAQTVGSLALSGSGIFGFDADGTLGGSDPQDYSGSLVSFSIASLDTGVVTFIGGLAANSDSFFELEEDVGVSGSGFTVGPVNSVPEPASLALVGAGLLAVSFLRRQKRL